MKYINFVNNLIKDEVAKARYLTVFGQNISAGSCLGGLTEGLFASPTGMILNTTNAENSLCGLGFGLMMGGVSGVFFMKQLDFLLLGVDQLVNTYNVIRNTKLKDSGGSFTIVPIVVDNGYQGPQSSLNNLSDFCSIARIPGFAVTNAVDAENIFRNHLVAPGFRIIGVSARLFGEEIIEPKKIVYSSEDSTIFQYSEGKDITIVCFNFSFPQGWRLGKDLDNLGIAVSLFNVNSPTPISWGRILDSVRSTGKLVVIDDSKSENIPGASLLAESARLGVSKKHLLITRKLGSDWLNPVSDLMEIQSEEVAHWVGG
ncbi:MAG: hypothetical protein AAB920_01105 [Patescibacteria group bacterium]